MKYYEKIDGLRFVAIAFVLIEHFASVVGKKCSAGYYGVDLFFVISGFLITGILLRSKGSFGTSYKNFVGRRTLRIFPIYYLTIAVLFVFGYQPIRDHIVSFATYTYNYAWIAQGIEPNGATHFWSLAIEEQFYLFWPIFILLFRNKPKVLFSVTASVIVLSFIQLTYNSIDAITPYNYVGLFPRAASLCLGALGAMLIAFGRTPHNFLNSRVVEYFTLILLVVNLFFDFQFKPIFLGYCSYYLVMKSVHSDFRLGFLNRFLSNSRIVFVGTISYGIYVFHLPIGYLLTVNYFEPFWMSIDFKSLGFFSFIQEHGWIITLPVFSAVSIGIAYLSNRYVEKPILTLKDTFFRYKE